MARAKNDQAEKILFLPSVQMEINLEDMSVTDPKTK
jgi:hypothetical protein